MGISLSGKGGDIYFNNLSWSQILKLADRYGWQPMGTEAPDWEVLDADPPIHADYPDWNGTYLSSDGQFVRDRDASNIAAALERALDDIPDHDAMEDKDNYMLCDRPPLDILRDIGAFKNPTGQDVSPIKWFSGQGKTRVRDFIEFSRAGGFCIF